MKICAHEWSARPHVGRESRICGRCNEWEVDIELSQARAAIVSLGKQRDDAYLDLREAREAHKAERDELEKHLSEAEDERDAAKAKVDRLRNALACISLDEYESTSSASDKVHGHARIARTALTETKDAWQYRCRGCQAKLADVVVDGKALPRVTLCDRCTEAELPAMWREDIQSLNECLERVSKELEETKKDRDEAKRLLGVVHDLVTDAIKGNAHFHSGLVAEYGCAVDAITDIRKRLVEAECERDASRGMEIAAERRGERLLRDRDLVDAKLAEANEALKTLTACNESLRGLFQKLRDAVGMPVEAEAEVTDRVLRELERLKPTALDRRDYDSALKEMFRRDHQKAVYNQAWEKAVLGGATREEAHEAARKAVQENPWGSKDKQ